MRALHALVYIALASFVPAQFALAQSASESEALLLVSAPQLREPNYYHTVVLAVPIENGLYVGVIINRPTRRTLASLFPEHEPSKKVAEPVFFGGPMSGRAVFAVVRAEDNPGRGAITLMKNLFLALTVNTVDRVIEQTPNQARYYVGNILWRPGELRAEIDRKVWHVMNADTDLVFRKDTEQLWEELSKMARAITANAGGLITTGIN
jgi:putative AlgH/UPF0301 family transcriptional regulator